MSDLCQKCLILRTSSKQRVPLAFLAQPDPESALQAEKEDHDVSLVLTTEKAEHDVCSHNLGQRKLHTLSLTGLNNGCIYGGSMAKPTTMDK